MPSDDATKAFALKSPLRRTQNKGTPTGTQPVNRLVARETLGVGLAGHRQVTLHLKQGPRLSNNWGPPQ